MNKLALLLLFVLMFSGFVSAVGITPGRTTLDFEPGLSREIEISVVNSDGKSLDFVAFVQGELNRSVALSDVSFSMSAGESEKKIKAIVTLPNDLSPGLHTAEVVVVQLPEKLPNSDNFVGAVVGVASQIHVHVPYPGKYAEVEMNIIGPDSTGKYDFVIPVHSRGDLDIVRARAAIDIYSPVNEKIATVTSNEISLLSGERKEVVASWTSSAEPGRYRAVATIIYDEETANIEKHFSVGTRSLVLDTVDVNDFTLGEIAKFELLVENKWSEPINGAYAQMLVYNANGDVMADFKSATYDIPALQKVLMVAFWDTDGVRTGTYDSSLFLRYGESSEQQELQLDVRENDINVVGVGYVISSSDSGGGGLFDSSLSVVLIVAVVILVLLNFVWFIMLRKRLKKRS